MAPIGLLPEHDDDSWLIAKIIDFAKLDDAPEIPHYVVHPKDSPVVQKVVPIASILDWVSPRVLEAFEFQKEIKRDAEKNEEKKKQEIEKRDAEKDEEKKEQKTKKPSKGKKRGRHYKTSSASELKDQTRETSIDPLADDSYAIHNPFPRQPSLSQPSLSQTTQSLKRKIESSITSKSTESTEDETGGSIVVGPPAPKRSRMGMNTEHKRKSSRLTKELISSQTQKNIAPSLPPARRSESMCESNTAPASQHNLRDRSPRPYFGRPIRPPRSISVTNTGSPMKSPSTPALSRYSTRSSSAAAPTSPQSATKKPVPFKPANSASQKTSKYFPATPRKPTLSKKPSHAPKAEEQDVETKKTDKKEWAVITLLDDMYQMVLQRHQRLFLVQWAGGYEPTWEKWSSISKDLRDEYDRRKAAMPVAATVAASDGPSSQASVQAASTKAAENPNNSSLFGIDDEEDSNEEEDNNEEKQNEEQNNEEQNNEEQDNDEQDNDEQDNDEQDNDEQDNEEQENEEENKIALFIPNDESDDNESDDNESELQAGSSPSASSSRASPAAQSARIKREDSDDSAPAVPNYSHGYSPEVQDFLLQMADADEAAEAAAKAAEAAPGMRWWRL